MSVSILVVDDEPDVADLFRQHFRREARQGTYVMHFAASGAEALDRLSGEIQPALVAVLLFRVAYYVLPLLVSLFFFHGIFLQAAHSVAARSGSARFDTPLPPSI